VSGGLTGKNYAVFAPCGLDLAIQTEQGEQLPRDKSKAPPKKVGLLCGNPIQLK
jgi:hypothetical protein